MTFSNVIAKGGADILTHFERTIPIHNQLSSCCSRLKENNWMEILSYFHFMGDYIMYAVTSVMATPDFGSWLLCFSLILS